MGLFLALGAVALVVGGSASRRAWSSRTERRTEIERRAAQVSPADALRSA